MLLNIILFIVAILAFLFQAFVVWCMYAVAKVLDEETYGYTYDKEIEETTQRKHFFRKRRQEKQDEVGHDCD